jgi:purine-binding chemotaxis protein CheW
MSQHQFDTNQRYLCFGLGEEEFAVPLLTVREVVAMPETTRMPFMPSYFVGIMNLRGMVISVVDLRQKMQIKPKENSENAVVILEQDGVSVGAVVDSVNSVLNVTERDFAENVGSDSKSKTNYVTGVYRKDNRLILLVDIMKSLTGEDMSLISRSSPRKAA